MAKTNMDSFYEIEKLPVLSYVSAGSYAKVYSDDTIAVKEYINYEENFKHTVLREGILLSRYGPKIRGVINDSRGRFAGIAMDAAISTMTRLNIVDNVIIADLLCDVLEDLEKLHLSGLVHGDIKPQNILLFSHHAKLCDFGLACWASDRGPCPSTYIDEMYTILYRPPELFVECPWSIYSSADIWALGVTIYSIFLELPIKDYKDPVSVLEGHTIMTRASVEDRLQLFNSILPVSIQNHYREFIVHFLAMCLDPIASKRSSATELYNFCKLYKNKQKYKFHSIYRSGHLKTYDITTLNYECPQISNDNLDLICSNIWNLVLIKPSMTIIKSSRKLFQLLQCFQWTISKTGVITAVLVGYLMRTAQSFKSAWCSRIANVDIKDYEESLTRALSVAILNSEWSEGSFGSQIATTSATGSEKLELKTD